MPRLERNYKGEKSISVRRNYDNDTREERRRRIYGGVTRLGEERYEEERERINGDDE